MRVTPFVASRFASDGGAMFGLVPKPIWSRRIPADDRNAIPQNANCLFLELEDGRRGLVDTGCGHPDRFSDKERAIHQLGDGWPLLDFLDGRGVAPADLDFVIFSHLHWDHAGGAGRPDGEGQIRPVFPNARHIVHRVEWQDAVSGDPLLYKSYPENVIAPLRDLGEGLTAIEANEEEVLPGVSLIRSGGHTRGHCIVQIRDEDLEIVHPAASSLPRIKELVFAADVCPTRHHLPLVFQTAYDTYPLDTRRWKMHWLAQIALEGMLLAFDHDPDAAAVTLQNDAHGQYQVKDTLPAGTE